MKKKEKQVKEVIKEECDNTAEFKKHIEAVTIAAMNNDQNAVEQTVAAARTWAETL